MRAFLVELENQPGGVARVSKAIGDRGINILAVAGATCGDRGTVGLITDDQDGAREALDAASLRYREMETVSALLNNEPGTLAAAAGRLAAAGVNVELLMPTGMDGPKVRVAFAIADPAAARMALAELLAPDD